MVAAASDLVNWVTAPSLSDSVNVPVMLPLRVRLSAPGSAIQPFFAAFAVKWVSSPLVLTTAAAVSEILRMCA